MKKKQESSLQINFFYNLQNQILLTILPLITAPYLSRVLGVENIGRYSYAQSIVSYFTMFAILGTSLYGQRRIAQQRGLVQERSRSFWGILLLRVFMTVMSLAVYCTLVLPRVEDIRLYLIVAIEILAVCFDISWFFQGLEYFQPVAVCNAVAKSFSAVCIFCFVKTQNDLLIYSFLYGGAILFSYILMFLYLRGKIERVKLQQVNPFWHIRPSFVLFLSQFAIQAYTVLDKTMIGLITNSEVQNGYYEQGQKLIRVLLSLVTAVGAVVASRVANLWQNGEKEAIQKLMERSFRLICSLAMPILLAVFVVASRFVPVFYGDGYSGVVPLLKILALLLPIIATSNAIGIQYLVPTKQERYLTMSVSIGAVVNVICNLILIPRYQAIGAAVGSVIAETAVTMYQVSVIAKQLKLLPFLKIMTRYLVKAVPMYVICSFADTMIADGFLGMLILTCVGVLVYLATLLVTRDSIIKGLLHGELL